MENNRVLEKIKKLLSLAQSDNENEARSAANKASALLVEHNLTVEQVNINRRFERTEVITQNKLKSYQVNIIGLLQDFFFVEALSMKRFQGRSAKRRRVYNSTLEFLGTQTNVEVATYVFTYLNNKYPELWKKYKKDTGAASSAKASYYLGLSKGLRIQLLATQKKVEEQVGLMVVKDAELKKYLDELTTGKTKRNAHQGEIDSTAYMAGAQDGKDLNISRGISSPTEKNGLLLK